MELSYKRKKTPKTEEVEFNFKWKSIIEFIKQHFMGD